MELMVSDYGSFLGKKSERLVLKQNGKVVQEIPFHDLEQVIIDTPGASLSTDLIKECMEHGIQISLLTSTGKPYAKLVSPYLTGTVITRREQLLAYYDARGINLVKSFIEGKLKNQANVLKYFAKYRKGTDPEAFERLREAIVKIENAVGELKEVTGKDIDEVRGGLLSVEGRAGNTYWEGVKLLLADKVEFPGREHQGTADPVNAAFNYGYGILTQQVETALLLAGLDIFGGFLHVDRAGKKSLVYDFIEEFRQAVVDRVIISAVNKGWEIVLADGQLPQETRRNLAGMVLERLDAQETFQGKKYKLKTIIQSQARRIATYLRGEAKYKPFVSGW
ncbi:CRISPR-associated protein Cas1 [Clostridiales bacterium PH28_bin88]|nr:CRISPR-associated protein Cas1 [Clostridiales bacterium PH28_bin88]